MTDIYLANKEEFIYSKVTTISPLYVVVNCTKSTILFAQTSCKQYPTFIKPNQHLQFHWSDKDKKKQVALRVIPSKHDRHHSEDLDWSPNGVELDEVGTLIVSNRQITSTLNKGK